MSETTANLMALPEPIPRPRRRPSPGTVGFLAGVLAATVFASLAAGPIREALAQEPVVAATDWSPRALDREWRGYKTPVDVDAMFRKRR